MILGIEIDSIRGIILSYGTACTPNSSNRVFQTRVVKMDAIDRYLDVETDILFITVSKYVVKYLSLAFR